MGVGLDYTKICETKFQMAPDSTARARLSVPYGCKLKEYCEGDLQKILEKAEKGSYQGKEYYRISFRAVIDYLVFHNILPEDNFLVTNLSI